MHGCKSTNNSEPEKEKGGKFCTMRGNAYQNAYHTIGLTIKEGISLGLSKDNQ